MIKEKKISKEETLTVLVKLSPKELDKIKMIQKEIGGGKGKAKAIKFLVNEY